LTPAEQENLFGAYEVVDDADPTVNDDSLNNNAQVGFTKEDLGETWCDYYCRSADYWGPA